MTAAWLRPVTLEGRFVSLEPLAARHVAGLDAYAAEEDTWRYMGAVRLTSPERAREYHLKTVEEARGGEAVTFAIVRRDTREVVGTTSVYDASEAHRRVEIGRTWVGAAHRRTGVNVEAKLLLLEHCFERLGCNRVQLKTDARNERSQRAIARLGATREGVLRAHMVLPDGFVRDTVMFSIVAAEWPAVKAHLEARLRRDPGAR